MARIHKDDTVKIIAGKNKGTTGKVLKVNTKDQTVLVEGVGVGHRHVKPSQYNPKGGKKDIHVPMDISKVALVVLAWLNVAMPNANTFDQNSLVFCVNF